MMKASGQQDNGKEKYIQNHELKDQVQHINNESEDISRQNIDFDESYIRPKRAQEELYSELDLDSEVESVAMSRF